MASDDEVDESFAGKFLFCLVTNFFMLILYTYHYDLVYVCMCRRLSFSLSLRIGEF